MSAPWDTFDADGFTVLRASWPDDRGVFWCEDDYPGADPCEAFVLADSADDAAEEMACANDHEGDSDRVVVRNATRREHRVVLSAVRRWLSELPSPY